MYKGNIHAPKHAKLIYENATAPVFSLISNGGFSWNLNICNSKGGFLLGKPSCSKFYIKEDRVEVTLGNLIKNTPKSSPRPVPNNIR